MSRPPRPVPDGDLFPPDTDEALRVELIRCVVMGVAMNLRRRTGQWPTTCEVLDWLARIGLDIHSLDDVAATPEAVVWLHHAERTETPPPDTPYGVLLWDEGADGLVRVVVPAVMQDELEGWLALGGP